MPAPWLTLPFMDERPTPERSPHLRLVWSNPSPPAPRRPLNLALAIQRHLAGLDGLSQEEFLRAYAGKRKA